MTEYSEEIANKVREIIAGITVNEANLKHIAEHGKINGSLHASLYDIIYKYEFQVLEQQREIENWKEQCESLIASRNEMITLYRKEVDRLETKLSEQSY